ncbi:uncharacterized protein M6B38_165430 [Iris pallida]|uniref:Uncharacterized protein n=1 Tax=Iris pallida TaxID=29817 RepID=A0AAX6EXU4_IRIPA|nr:Uncharacterized protein M6B38_231450 [Iris pallida]KAJ6808751.1 uncharacterized protein M6B38_165430 [Iris pallida]
MANRAVKYAIIDAFTDIPFKGNPAAVCLLESEADEKWMQSAAKEFNVSETAFLSRARPSNYSGTNSSCSSSCRFSLRWFTPLTEVKLCGHATMAAAHFLVKTGIARCDVIEFDTASGVLKAKVHGLYNLRIPLQCTKMWCHFLSILRVIPRCHIHKANGRTILPFESWLNTSKLDEEAQENFSLELDFPMIAVIECDPSEIPSIPKTLNGLPMVNVQKSATHGYIIVELASGKDVANLQPDFDELAKCVGRAVIITAPAPAGSGFDIFSRFFAPKLGINEDPVSGSAHCALAPYWGKKLSKHNLIAYQASPRGGRLELQLEEETKQVHIIGLAVTTMVGTLMV